MIRTLSILALASASIAAVPGAAVAQDAIHRSADDVARPVTPEATPKKIRSIDVKPGQSCPKGTGDEIVVCSTNGEPYRLPKEFRRLEPTGPNNSWVNRTAYADDVSRRAGGLPDSCSPVGSGGQSGCAMQIARNYSADKRAAAREGYTAPSTTTSSDDATVK